MEKIFYCIKKETISLIRFYNDGLVLGVPIGSDEIEDLGSILKWFNRENYFSGWSKGRYTISYDNISFDLDSNVGIVKYAGKIVNGGELILKSESLINGNISTERYFQVKGNSILRADIPNYDEILTNNSLNLEYYLFFDTETTGLPKNWKAPVSDLNNWPRLVQLAFLLYDKQGNKIFGENYIIKPEGYTIPNDAARLHGITTERATREGKVISIVLKEFKSQIDKAHFLVAHNMSFDEKIVGAEFLRNGMSNSLSSKEKICTMERTTNFCAIDGPYGYKWPKLSELHYKLFKTHFEEAHNAMVDIDATAKCFWELKKLGKI